MIEFISYEQFPEDNYTKELVYLQIDGKYRVAYVAKIGKSGNTFWTPVSIGITQNGAKKYFPAIVYDSNFLEKEIQELLKSRPWEKNKAPVYNAAPTPPPGYASYRSPEPQYVDEPLPF